MVRKATPTAAVARIIGYIILTIVAGMMVVPFMWMVTTSFKTQGTEFSYPPQILPSQFDLTNYQTLFNNLPFARYFLNTVIVTLATVTGQLVVCSLAAYGFARLNFMGRDTIFVLYLTTMMIPFQITLIPLFLIVFGLGWVNTYWGLTVPLMASATGTFLFRQFFQTIPDNLAEAAQLDGAGPLRFLWSFLLPLSRANLAALFVILFVYGWNEYLWPLLITTTAEMRTAVVGLEALVPRGGSQLPEWHIIMAAAMMVLLPPVAVIVLMQRWFVKGLIEAEK